MKLVTIICEALAREPIIRLLKECGAHGYTLFAVEGEGAQGERAGGMEEFRNVQIDVVVKPSVAEELLSRLKQDFFPRYAMIAYESDVRVLRPDKF